MPKLIPMHTVILSRPNKAKRKDKEGQVIHERVSVPLGKPFDFTPEEIEDLKASGHTFRTPINEDATDDGEILKDADEADKAAAEAQAEATKKDAEARVALVDAANTRRAANPSPSVQQSGANLPNNVETDDEEL